MRKNTKTDDKSSGRSMLSRFNGGEGSRRLLEVLASTALFHDIPGLDELVARSRLVEVPHGTELMQQGAADDDVHLIISGSFHIEVNGRLWITRYAGTHIGEAAMIDPTARRNATARAAEPSLVLTSPEAAFSTFANKNPAIWRRVAAELSRRLTERTKLVPIPRSEPVLFLGCSTEALSIAQEIQASFEHDKVDVQIWTDGIFNPSKTAIEDLMKLAANVDFAALLLTPDDKITSRGRKYAAARDNVVFELGLMVGAIGRDRTLLLVQRGTDTKLPSDLIGITPIQFSDLTGASNVRSRLGPLCTNIRNVIKQLGPI